MLKFTGRNPETGNTIIGIGLSRLNCERLLKGEPIIVDAKTDLHLPYSIELLIFAGENENTMTADLERNGFELPDDPDRIHIDPKVGG